MQVPFHLPGNVKYKCDFFVVWADGKITVEDVKGVKTPIYILKKKQVEEIYNITIQEIKKNDTRRIKSKAYSCL